MAGIATHQLSVLHALEVGRCIPSDALAAATGLTPKAVTQAAGKLIRRGLVTRAERGCFELTAAGLAARASGEDLTSAPVAPSTAHRRHPQSLRVRAWRAVRMARKFTVADIEMLAARDERNANGGVQRYLLLLWRAGYLHRLRRKASGEVRYTLLRDTGPDAPMLARDRQSLRDGNTGEVYACVRAPSELEDGDAR